MSAYSELQLSSFIDQVFERLRAIEGQLAILSEKAEVPYDAPSLTAPEEVLELVQAGDRIGALLQVPGADRLRAGRGERDDRQAVGRSGPGRRQVAALVLPGPVAAAPEPVLR